MYCPTTAPQESLRDHLSLAFLESVLTGRRALQKENLEPAVLQVEQRPHKRSQDVVRGVCNTCLNPRLIQARELSAAQSMVSSD